MSALVTQVQPPTGEKNIPVLFRSWKKTNFPCAIRVQHGAQQEHSAISSLSAPPICPHKQY
eukprot:4795596-Ditylum_brightwellii.AAC.1